MQKYLLLLILFIAGILRLWILSDLPPSLNWDEVSIGYNSYSILKTGKDEWGEILPLSFKAYGDYKLPGYIYLDVPFIAIFGLNSWGVRLPSALIGIGFILLIFLILKNLTNINTALLGMFLAAILPWEIILSRVALEAHLALILTTAGIFAFIKGLKKGIWLILAAVLFGLSIFSYNSSRIVMPLLIFLLILIYRKDLIKIKNISLIAFTIFLAFFIVAVPKAILQDSSARYKWTVIVDEGAIAYINEQRNISNLNPVLAKLFFNRITYFIPNATKNYLSYFDPRFLYFYGGTNYQFSVPGFGLIYPILLPFLFFGLLKIYQEKTQWQLLLLGWLILSPIPAAITRDAPHALRSLLMLPSLIIITTLGFEYFLKIIKLRKEFLLTALIIVLLLSTSTFWIKYSTEYKKSYSWAWQYGYQQLVDFIKNEGNKYSKIYITKKYGEPHEFLLFYLNYDPQKYKLDTKLIRYFRSDWYWVDGFDKYVFMNDWEIEEKVRCISSDNNCLLITSPGNYKNGQKIKTIYFLDDRPAFDLVEI